MAKIFVIHPECINIDLRLNLHLQYRPHQLDVLSQIKTITKNARNLVVIDDYDLENTPKDGDVYLLEEGPTRLVAGCIVRKDEAIFIGAYTEKCVSEAANVARRAGAIVTINRKLTVPLDPRLYSEILK
ncbi:hypothetical protein KBC75_00380 [Candidatus Shapirobacteria bacterium]|nr:hypothetical protein [Candidatus Shapirobacteria bacterium]